MKKFKMVKVIMFALTLIFASCDLGDTGSESDDTIDKVALTTAVAAANELEESLVVGDEVGNISQSDLDLYTAAIDVAQSVISDSSATDDSVTQAISDLATATTTVNSAILTADDIENEDLSYVYQTSGDADITSTLSTWSSGTTLIEEYDGDSDYSKTIQITSGSSWDADAACVAFTSMESGKINEFTQLDFKVLTSDYTTIRVKIPGSTPDEELSFNLSDGTEMNNGWIEMSILLSEWGSISSSVDEFAILEFGTGAMLLTDIGFSGTAEVDETPEESDLTDPVAAATAADSLTDSALVIYSDEQTVDAQNPVYMESWSARATLTEIQIDSDNILKYDVDQGSDVDAVIGISFDSLDVSSKTGFHMDLYAQGDVDLMKMKFVSPENGEAAGYASMLDAPDALVTTTDAWTSVDFELSSIATAGGAGPVDWSELIQIVLIVYGPASTFDEETRFFVDNVYFY